MGAPALERAHNVLCVRLDSLSDVLMCTPAIRAIRDTFPAARLTLLTSHSGAAAAPYIAELDNVIAYRAPWMKHSASHGAAIDCACIDRLAQARFDAACIFTSYSQSALPAAMLCHMAGIPVRLAHCRENPYQLLTHWVAETEPENLRHEVQRQLDLVASIGCNTNNARLSFRVRDADTLAVLAHTAALGIAPDTKWILLHPGATAPSHRYPAEHWSTLIDLLARRTGLPMILTGDMSEREMISEILNGCASQVHTLAGQLNLGQLGAAIRLAALVVSNNTGPAHMAAAIGTPLVNLYALTNPQHTPWQVDHRVLFHDVPCRFCQKSICPQGHHDCLRKIAPDSVADAVCSLLA
jgi:lipopolysaccharide heptosyltransferase II